MRENCLSLARPWAAYDAAGRRTDGPHVERPQDLAEKLPTLGVHHATGEGAEIYRDILGLELLGVVHPTPEGLVAAAAAEVLAKARPAALTPLYLRKPDAEINWSTRHEGPAA